MISIPDPGFPDVVRMVVEIPKGSSNKYEYDGELRAFRLDRVCILPYITQETTVSSLARWHPMAIRWM